MHYQKWGILNLPEFCGFGSKICLLSRIKRCTHLIRLNTVWMFGKFMLKFVCKCKFLDSEIESESESESEQSKLILIKRICSSMHEMLSVSINHSRFKVYITIYSVLSVCVYTQSWTYIFLRALPTSSPPPNNMDAVSNSLNSLQFVLVREVSAYAIFSIYTKKRDKNWVNWAPFIAATHSID